MSCSELAPTSCCSMSCCLTAMASRWPRRSPRSHTLPPIDPYLESETPPTLATVSLARRCGVSSPKRRSRRRRSIGWCAKGTGGRGVATSSRRMLRVRTRRTSSRPRARPNLARVLGPTWVRFAAWPLSLAVGLIAVHAMLTSDLLAPGNLEMDSLDPGPVIAGVALVGWSTAIAGLGAWWRRPDRYAGPLLVAAAWAWFIGAASWATDGGAFQGYYVLLIAVLLLTYPSGRLASPAARLLVVVMLAVLAASTVGRLVFDAGPAGYDPNCLLPDPLCAPIPDAFVNATYAPGSPNLTALDLYNTLDLGFQLALLTGAVAGAGERGVSMGAGDGPQPAGPCPLPRDGRRADARRSASPCCGGNQASTPRFPMPSGRVWWSLSRRCRTRSRGTSCGATWLEPRWRTLLSASEPAPRAKACGRPSVVHSVITPCRCWCGLPTPTAYLDEARTTDRTAGPGPCSVVHHARASGAAARGDRLRRSLTGGPGAPRARCRRPRPRPSRTIDCRRKCRPSSPRCRHPEHGSSPPRTSSANDWSATCMTVPSNSSSPSRWTSGRPASVWTPQRSPSWPAHSRAHRRVQTRRSASCASSPGAFTPPSSRRLGWRPRSSLSPCAHPSR